MKKLKETGRRLLADVKEYGMAGILFLAYYGLVHLFRTAFCPMIHFTGLPCAGCGLTRAFLFLLRGEFARAASINPMVYLVIFFLLYCGFFRYIKGTKIKGFSVLFGSVIAVMLLFYLIRMYQCFPERVPYVYARDNVLANHWPAYQEMITRCIRFLREVRG